MRYFFSNCFEFIFGVKNLKILKRFRDLSNGCERFPVRVVNDMDKTRLSAFKYVNRIIDEHGLLNLPEDELAVRRSDCHTHTHIARCTESIELNCVLFFLINRFEFNDGLWHTCCFLVLSK